MRFLTFVTIVLGFLVGCSGVAWAQPAVFVIELQGARVTDTVCVASKLPSSLDKRQDERERQLAADRWAQLRCTTKDHEPRSTRETSLGAFLDKLGSGSWNPSDDALDWGWQHVCRDDDKPDPYLTCTSNGSEAPPRDARLLLLHVFMDPNVTGAIKDTDVLRGALSLTGTSLRLELVHSSGHLAANDNRNDLTVEVLAGASYEFTSRVTKEQRTTLSLRPTLPDFSFQLPESPSLWEGAIVTRSDDSGNSRPTAQAYVQNGILQGAATAGTEFAIGTMGKGPGGRELQARYRVGSGELTVETFSLTWTSPPALGDRGRHALQCPDVSLPDHVSWFCRAVPSDGDQCYYRCTDSAAAAEPSPGSSRPAPGLALPTRLRFRAGTLDWEDSLTWGRFATSSFATPTPALLRFRPSEDTVPRYVVVGEDGARGTSFRLDCDRTSKWTFDGANCLRWTTRLPRGLPDDIVYQYFGGARYRVQRLSDVDGAYTLDLPYPKRWSVTLVGGVQSKFRVTDAGRPSVGFHIGLELGYAPDRSFLFVMHPEWRYGPRGIIETDGHPNSIPTSTIASTLGVFHCLPCQGGGYPRGWLGILGGVAAEYPAGTADAQTTGQWFAEFEGELAYRLQPLDDGWWGLLLAAGVGQDGRWEVATRQEQQFFALRGALSLWAYLY
jgi:hypothetical protein